MKYPCHLHKKQSIRPGYNKAGSMERLCHMSPSRPSQPAADASRDLDNVPAKAGNQASNDVIEISLDSPSTLLRTVSLSNGLSNHGSRPP